MRISDWSSDVCSSDLYGRFRYEAQKKKNEARKKQKIIEVKEIKMRPNIDVHDYEVKMRSIHRFIEEGDKVKVTMRFRGREMRSEEHTSELQSLMRISYAVFCLNKKTSL